MCHAAGTHPGETTADGTLTIEFAECLGACEFAPCMLAGRTLYKNLTPELGEKFVAQCRSGGGSEPPEKEINGPIVAGGPAIVGSSSTNGHPHS